MFRRAMMWVPGAAISACVATLVFLSAGAEPQTRSNQSNLKFLPPNTDVVVVVRNIEELKAKFGEAPFSTFWNHPGIQQVVNKIQNEMDADLKKFRSKVGFTISDFLSVFDGEVIFACSDTISYCEYMMKRERKKSSDENDRGAGKDEKNVPLPDLYFVADVKRKGDEAAKYMKSIFSKASEEEKTFRVNRDSFRGVELFAFGDDKVTCQYAQFDNLFVVTTTLKAMEQFIVMKQKGGESVADQPDFQKAMKKIGASNDIYLSINFTSVNKMIAKAIEAGLADSPMGAEREANARLVDGLLNDCLGLNCLTTVAGGFAIESGGMSSNFFFATKGEAKGLIKLIGGKNDKLAFPSYIPKDATWASIGEYEIAPFWASLEKMVGDFVKSKAKDNPDFPAVNPFDMMEMMLGFDIKEDVIDNLGPTVVVYTGKPAGQDEKEASEHPKFVLVLSLKDEKKTAGILAKLQKNPQFGRMLKSEEYLGKTLYTVGGEGAVAVFNNMWVIGSLDEVKGLVRRVGKEVESISDNESYRQLSPWVPATCSALSYADGSYYYQIFKAIVTGMGDSPMRKRRAPRLPDDENGDEGNPFEGIDPKKLPDEEFFTNLLVGSVSSTVVDTDGIVFQSYAKFRTGRMRK